MIHAVHDLTIVKIDTADAGDYQVVVAQSDKSINAVAYYFVVGGAQNVKFTDGAGGDDLSGQMNITANGGMVACSPTGIIDQHGFIKPWLKTSTSTSLVMNLSASEQVGGNLIYYLSD